VKLEMIKIPAGSFMMGSNERDDEKPIHRVTLKEFYLGKYPVTQEQWQAVMGNNPSYFGGRLQNPVEYVSWDDCQEFCRRLSKLTGKTYRLPSEAEWEYACRAGTNTRYSFGSDPAELGEYAWYSDNSSKTTHPVGKKKPNLWGLYDIHGNVWEWCEDGWYQNYMEGPINGAAWVNNYSQIRVVRGGSWKNAPRFCYSANRSNDYLSLRSNSRGFRLALG
jgi:formylglycine-generating enzyme required for sulfatase activity